MLFDSPLILGGEITDADVLMAVLVCSDNRADQLSTLATFQRSRVFRAVCACLVLTYDMERETSRLIKYVESFTESPDFFTSGPSKRSAIPIPFNVVASLLMHMNIDEDRAWDMPFSLALCYRGAIMEANGVEILDEQIVEKLPDIDADITDGVANG